MPKINKSCEERQLLDGQNLIFFFKLNETDFLMCFPAIDAPGGFLFEWWSVFWDIFIARTNEKHSEAAASYIEVCLWMLASM